MKPYHIVESDSGTHGEIFEHIDDHFFDVIDSTTNEVVVTFQSESSGDMDGSGGFRNEGQSGVEKVELSEDGCTLVYQCHGSEKLHRIELPV